MVGWCQTDRSGWSKWQGLGRVGQGRARLEQSRVKVGPGWVRTVQGVAK